MTIKNLFEICENLQNIDDVMLYDSVEDFDNATSNWKSCNADSIKHSDIKIGKFRIYNGFVAIAMA